jgi:hypothetical protein
MQVGSVSVQRLLVGAVAGAFAAPLFFYLKHRVGWDSQQPPPIRSTAAFGFFVGMILAWRFAREARDYQLVRRVASGDRQAMAEWGKVHPPKTAAEKHRAALLARAEGGDQAALPELDRRFDEALTKGQAALQRKARYSRRAALEYAAVLHARSVADPGTDAATLTATTRELHWARLQAHRLRWQFWTPAT